MPFVGSTIGAKVVQLSIPLEIRAPGEINIQDKIPIAPESPAVARMMKLILIKRKTGFMWFFYVLWYSCGCEPLGVGRPPRPGGNQIHTEVWSYYGSTQFGNGALDRVEWVDRTTVKAEVIENLARELELPLRMVRCLSRGLNFSRCFHSLI